MKLLDNKNDEKEMKAFEPSHDGKRVDFLVATLPTELHVSMLTTNNF